MELPKTNFDIRPTLLDLIRLRACQIYRDPVGLERYTLELKAMGESAQRLVQLKEWRKSSLFTKEECAALALCEAIVLHPTEHIAKELMREARIYFNKVQLVSLTLTILDLMDWSHLSACYFLEDEGQRTRATFHRIE